MRKLLKLSELRKGNRIECWITDGGDGKDITNVYDNAGLVGRLEMDFTGSTIDEIESVIKKALAINGLTTRLSGGGVIYID